MADVNPAAAEAAEPPARLEAGAYEVIRNRLRTHGRELQSRLERLNAARREVFGAVETRLLGTERITTANNCTPRDIVAVGQRFLFGYNVHIGLKSETALDDVFAVYDFRDGKLHEQSLELLGNEQFLRDFREVYRYYKDAQFAKFFKLDAFVYMVFRVGKNPTDIKAFKWVRDGDALHYLDNRSDHEVRFPPQHEFQWKRTTRDQHLYGVHPHVSIEDRVFVETVGGDLTIKIENNTESGEGIYREPVDNVDQTLDDAEIHYALVGHLVLLRVRPYQEQAYRHFVYNGKTQTAVRIDSLAEACVLLPEDQGLIFPNGYYLQNGNYKTFDHALSNLLFERRVPAPNGEDWLYRFYNRATGDHVLLQYNMIEQRVATPLVCHGATLFPDGELICFKAEPQPQKHHALQIWQTPYAAEAPADVAQADSLLFKIGNRDLVRAMAECRGVLQLIERDEAYADLYVDLAKEVADVLDTYFWLGEEQACGLREPLQEIRGAATAAIDEFEKVVRVRQATTAQSQQTARHVEELIARIRRERFEKIDEFVACLRDLRATRGKVISLRDLRYVDLASVDALERQVQEQADELAGRCVQFLLREDALAPLQAKGQSQRQSVAELSKVADATRLSEETDALAAELEMLIDVVSNLKIDDATQRTAIVDRISAIFAVVNQTRSALKARRRELMSVEGAAEFGSQMKLLSQGVVSFLDVADSPQKCDELLTRLMVQVEELEGRFAEFDEFVGQLVEKREEIYSAFEQRKLTLVEARARRAAALAAAADRILKGIGVRVGALQSLDEINGYFAADLMIEKVRDLVRQLDELDDNVRVDEIQGRLKTIREDAVRQLKDRQELFVGGANVIQLGQHRFTVNVQPLDLTSVLRDDAFCLHLTGTQFFEPLDDPELASYRDLWNQELASENEEVSRAEYLAYRIFEDLRAGQGELDLAAVPKLSPDELVSLVQRAMAPRYAEGYLKGVHDHDAAILLRALVEMHLTLGGLRHAPHARTMARVLWSHFVPPPLRDLLGKRLRGFGEVEQSFAARSLQEPYLNELAEVLRSAATDSRLFAADDALDAAAYLLETLARGLPLTASRRAADLRAGLETHLQRTGQQAAVHASLQALADDPRSQFLLARDWAAAYLASVAGTTGQPEDADFADELGAVLAFGTGEQGALLEGSAARDLDGLASEHPLVREGRFRLSYHRFLGKLRRYDREAATRFRQFQQRKQAVLEESRRRLRLDEFQPRVLTSFVRNRLIDEVYLPLIGDNLAKQIGVAGESKRTDLMGLLLLVSPPGYGKTTLMEYLANRLGLIFMKINGPAIGHQVTSLDPTEARNAAARDEIEKLNLALEMGDNVMLYLDDIQHCHPELLQKFISLCDAQRKIEGVYRGRSRTYDLRGRKVVIVMAGNPYTESGEQFKIPDMLANRADVYNLGEIIGDNAEAFELSFLENALTSNPALAKLNARSRRDVYAVAQIAAGGAREGVEFEGVYAPEELDEMVSVMRKLLTVRDAVLKANREYIRSAAMADEYRTEPPFKLQGSYRNMNRMAERVSALMNDAELATLILSSYENDAQTLTRDSEANLLKFKELLGRLSPAEAERWEHIKAAFARNARLKGVSSDDRMGQAVLQLGAFAEGLDGIRRTMAEGVQRLLPSDAAPLRDEPPSPAQFAEALAALRPQLPPQEVIVQHKIPRVVLGVVKAQFELMDRWLQPLLAAETAQNQEMGQLREAVEKCLASYDALMQELRDSEEKT